MKRNKVLTYLLFLLLPLAVGGLAALVTYHGMPVYEQLEKPVFTPPSFLFPIVWTGFAAVLNFSIFLLNL